MEHHVEAAGPACEESDSIGIPTTATTSYLGQAGGSVVVTVDIYHGLGQYGFDRTYDTVCVDRRRTYDSAYELGNGYIALWLEACPCAKAPTRQLICYCSPHAHAGGGRLGCTGKDAR